MNATASDVAMPIAAPAAGPEMVSPVEFAVAAMLPIMTAPQFGQTLEALRVGISTPASNARCRPADLETDLSLEVAATGALPEVLEQWIDFLAVNEPGALLSDVAAAEGVAGSNENVDRSAPMLTAQALPIAPVAAPAITAPATPIPAGPAAAAPDESARHTAKTSEFPRATPAAALPVVPAGTVRAPARAPDQTPAAQLAVPQSAARSAAPQTAAPLAAPPSAAQFAVPPSAAPLAALQVESGLRPRDQQAVRQAAAEVVTLASLTSSQLAVAPEPQEAPLVATRVISTPVGHERWAQSLAQEVRWCMNNEVQRAAVQLVPEDLGPIEIRIEIRDGQINVNFNAAQTETRAALDQSLPRLRELMHGAGLMLGDVTVHSQARRESHNPSTSARGLSDALNERETTGTLRRIAVGLVDVYA